MTLYPSQYLRWVLHVAGTQEILVDYVNCLRIFLVYIVLMLNPKAPGKIWVSFGNHSSSDVQIESVLVQTPPWDFFTFLQMRRLPGTTLACLLSGGGLLLPLTPEVCGGRVLDENICCFH